MLPPQVVPLRGASPVYSKWVSFPLVAFRSAKGSGRWTFSSAVRTAPTSQRTKRHEFLRGLGVLLFQDDANPIRPLSARTEGLADEAIEADVELRRILKPGVFESIE